ncbi:unnamed protein product [Phyllotreta striolata]|uniref:G2/mitotic-specific cyclin-B3 n=1 Tax=Phyllotreta striolata TaxID=444603 RepID=A0A9N9TX11_PHYSR|nr:unnamed protein product [Phyllotreta striolata]
MAPTKSSASSILSNLPLRTTISTRSRAATQSLTNVRTTKLSVISVKRKADASPSKDAKTTKRIAFSEKNINITEAKTKQVDAKQKITLKKAATQVKTVTTLKAQLKTLPSVKTVARVKQNENIAPLAPVHKVYSRKPTKIVVPNQTAIKPKEVLKENNTKCNKRLSNDFEKTEDTLYSSALEDISSNESTYFSAKRHNLRSSRSSESESTSFDKNEKTEENASSVSMVARRMEIALHLGNHSVPDQIDDFDKENWEDVFQISEYAIDIFHYLKERESSFPIVDYLGRQVCLTRIMRSLLVDWMVEIQESFELNHETLYLGVKIVDMYLGKVVVGKETLQLVGAASMFIASKFDERIPPLIDDFLYICDGAYTKRELIRMEMNLLQVINFDLGIPISYRFLRRYARCAKIPMPILTLARYILEYNLMNYDVITIRDSKLASAALYMALRMKEISNWTPTLEFYTGYKLEEFKDVIVSLNNYLSQPAKSQLMTVRNKYSHKIFFEVAKIPLLKNEQF